MKKTIYHRWLGGFFLISLFFVATTVRAERLAVSGETANVRSGPGTEHTIIWKVEKYHPVNITKVSGGWYQFEDFEGDIGWIHKSLVKKISTIITKSDKCNVREGPGTNKNVLFSVDRGIPFKVEKRQGKWIRIQHADGDTGWIHQSLVW